VSEPERLFQVEYPGMAEGGFPALSAEAGFRSHLPIQVTRFFGRGQEIAQLTELLGVQGVRSSGGQEEKKGGERHKAQGENPIPNTQYLTPIAKRQTPERLNARLVTLTGPGGSGKTRLALATAERLVETYQNAVWFVPLADLADPRRIADNILDTL